jgi:hypothetical protein
MLPVALPALPVGVAGIYGLPPPPAGPLPNDVVDAESFHSVPLFGATTNDSLVTVVEEAATIDYTEQSTNVLDSYLNKSEPWWFGPAVVAAVGPAIAAAVGPAIAAAAFAIS